MTQLRIGRRIFIAGFAPQLGMHSVDRMTFKRTAKRSAYIYGGIARANAI